MWIRTQPSSLVVQTEALTPRDNETPLRELISLELIPTREGDHIDLDTGEVFQDEAYARLRKKETKLIRATASIRARSIAAKEQINTMRYWAGSSRGDNTRPSSIHFDVFVAPSVFDSMIANFRCGIFPQTITFKLIDEASP